MKTIKTLEYNRGDVFTLSENFSVGYSGCVYKKNKVYFLIISDSHFNKYSPMLQCFLISDMNNLNEKNMLRYLFTIERYQLGKKVNNIPNILENPTIKIILAELNER